MLCARNLPSIFVLVCPSGLMFDQLLACFRVLTFAQSREMRCSYRTVQIPIFCQYPAPLAMCASVMTPIILLFRTELGEWYVCACPGESAFEMVNLALNSKNRNGPEVA
jgi:hypothetical protein